MGKVTELACVICGRIYQEDRSLYACSSCGDLGTLRVFYDYEAVGSVLTRESLAVAPLSDQWRYLPLLPLTAKVSLPLRVGATPLYNVDGLRRFLGLRHLWVKDDTLNPSGSLKDRASAVVILKGRELGYDDFATASTGNAASSLACFAASLGVRCHIFVPETAPTAKMIQSLVFGADVLPIHGSYDDAFDLCIEACQTLGWYNRNTGYNPYTIEGKKTVTMEMMEQLGWEVPDTVVVPVGDGCILSGVWKGFVDLKRTGMIDRLPRLVAAQAEGSQAIKQAYDSDGCIRPVTVQTFADSVAVSLPRNGTMAIQDIKASGGLVETATDDEILEAIKLLGRSVGIFSEPAGVLGLAVLVKLCAKREISKDERVALIVSGSGLKDVDAVHRGLKPPKSLSCSIDAVRAHLEIRA